MHENGLEVSLQALQTETNTRLNGLSNIDSIVEYVVQGSWEKVFDELKYISHVPEIFDLYELVCVEMAAISGDGENAQRLLSHAQSLIQASSKLERRVKNLEKLISQQMTTGCSSFEAYFEGASVEARRAKVASRIQLVVSKVPPSRLLTLLGEALRSQANFIENKPLRFDLVKGLIPTNTQSDQTQIIPTDIKFSPGELNTSKSIPKCYLHQSVSEKIIRNVECAAFIKETNQLLLGLSDSFVLIAHKIAGIPSTIGDTDQFIMDAAVTCMSNSINTKIAIGTIGNPTASIGIYDSTQRAIQRTIPDAHHEGVSSVFLRKNYLLSSGYDGKICIWDCTNSNLILEITIRSSSALKNYATEVCWSHDGKSVIAVTSDGQMGVWKVDLVQKSSHKVFYSHPMNTKDTMLIRGLRFIKPYTLGTRKYYIVIPIGSQDIFIIEDLSFQVKCTIILPPDRGTICAATVSGTILYLVHDSGILSTVHIDHHNLENESLNIGELHSRIESNETPIKISETEVIGIAADPETEYMISFDLDGNVQFWCTGDHTTD